MGNTLGLTALGNTSQYIPRPKALTEERLKALVKIYPEMIVVLNSKGDVIDAGLDPLGNGYRLDTRKIVVIDPDDPKWRHYKWNQVILH